LGTYTMRTGALGFLLEEVSVYSFGGVHVYEFTQILCV
jgi:hypothetical protein